MQRPPFWYAYRTRSGAAGAGWLDPVDLADAALDPAGTPPFTVFDASADRTVLVYWTATNENRAAHTLTFEPLIWDGVNSRWVVQPTFTLLARQVGEFPVNGCNRVGLRVHAQAAAGASDAAIFVTGGERFLNS